MLDEECTHFLGYTILGWAAASGLGSSEAGARQLDHSELGAHTGWTELHLTWTTDKRPEGLLLFIENPHRLARRLRGHQKVLAEYIVLLYIHYCLSFLLHLLYYVS